MKKIILLSFVVFVLFAFPISANNASINATGPDVSPTFIMSCNISGFDTGLYQYTLYKDGVNISSGQYNSNATTPTTLTSVNQETAYSEVGSWDSSQPENAVDENSGTFEVCNPTQHNCYITEWLNFSYIEVFNIDWVYVYGVAPTTSNNSLPTGCLVENGVKIYTQSDNSQPETATRSYCWNGSAYETIFLDNDAGGDPRTGRLYEGIWEINHSNFIYTNTTTNIYNYTVTTAGEYVFSCRITNFTHATSWSNSSAYTTTIFNLSAYNELTGELINETIDLWLVSESEDNNQSINKSFSIGSTTFSLDALDYRIIIDSNNFQKRNYFFPNSYLSTIDDNIDIFLLNYSGDFSIIKVIDEFGYPVENAVVFIYKNIPEFTGEKVIGILKTNFEGEASFDFIRYTDDYRFIVYNSAGAILKTSDKTTIDKDTIKIQVNDISDPYDSFKAYLGATTRLWITNGTTSNRTAHYYFSGDSLTYGCVRVNKAVFSSFDEEVCETCLTATAGVVTCDYNYTTSGTYFASGHIHTDTLNSEHKTDEMSDTGVLDKDKIGAIGLFVAFLLWITGLLMFRHSPILGLVFGVFTLILLAVTQIILLPVVALITIVIYVIFKGVLISK